MYSKLIRRFQQRFGENLGAIIRFGSKARGLGRATSDVDLIIILKHLPENLREVEKQTASSLFHTFGTTFDLHLFTVTGFSENLVPGSFVLGIFLGYDLLFDRLNVKEIIERARERLKGKDIVYKGKYGRWNISKVSQILKSYREFRIFCKTHVPRKTSIHSRY